eukprot:2930904-Rhodomonas_salina.1
MIPSEPNGDFPSYPYSAVQLKSSDRVDSDSLVGFVWLRRPQRVGRLSDVVFDRFSGDRRTLKSLD